MPENEDIFAAIQNVIVQVKTHFRNFPALFDGQSLPDPYIFVSLYRKKGSRLFRKDPFKDTVFPQRGVFSRFPVALLIEKTFLSWSRKLQPL